MMSKSGKKRTRRAYIDWSEFYDTIREGAEKHLSWKKIASNANLVSTQGKITQHTMQTWWSKIGKKLESCPPKKRGKTPKIQKIQKIQSKHPKRNRRVFNEVKLSNKIRISSIVVKGTEIKVPTTGLTKEFVLSVAGKIDNKFADDLKTVLNFVEL